MAVAIREHLVARLQALEALEPAALDLAASVLAVLHEECHGRAAELRGTRSPEYRRRQLLGRDGLPVEGVCYLALTAPGAVIEGLQVLARALGYRLAADEPDEGRSVAAEAGQVMERMGTLASSIVQAMEDGRITPEEAVTIDRRIHVLRSDMAALEFAVHELACGYGVAR